METILLATIIPVFYLFVSWRMMIYHWREHGVLSTSSDWSYAPHCNHGKGLCDSKGEAAFATTLVGLTWPISFLVVFLRRRDVGYTRLLDRAANKPSRAEKRDHRIAAQKAQLAQYEANRKKMKSRIEELEKELGLGV